MQAHALSPVPVDPSPDPIALLVQEGRHREALAACVRAHGAVLGRLCMALLGSQAEAVLRLVQIPVVLVPMPRD